MLRHDERRFTVTIPRLYTIDEVVAVAHAPRGSVQFWVYSGKLPSLKVGRRRLIAEDALRRFLGLDTADAKQATRHTK
jgi:excisionase family DNA binding protein